MMGRVIVVFALVVSCIEHTKSEVFTSVSQLEDLLTIEKHLLQLLDKHITVEKSRLKRIEEFASKVKGVLHSATEGHLSNPINAYQLINRYANGWMKLDEDIYNTPLAENFMGIISLHSHMLPTNEDLEGASDGLRRLQDTYLIDPLVMAQGNLTDDGLSLTSMDCYKIGKGAYYEHDWNHTRDWMLAALHQFDKEHDPQSLLVDIYFHLSYAECSLGNMEKVLEYSHKLLQDNDSLIKQSYFTKLFQQPEYYKPVIRTADDEEVFFKYQQVCRKSDPFPSKLHKYLKCHYYDDHHHPRLVLQPVKLEIAFVKPTLYIFHDFVSDKEIERLKELASPRVSNIACDVC
jgi:prolyl 4-hydroxylase